MSRADLPEYLADSPPDCTCQDYDCDCRQYKQDSKSFTQSEILPEDKGTYTDSSQRLQGTEYGSQCAANILYGK